MAIIQTNVLSGATSTARQIVGGALRHAKATQAVVQASSKLSKIVRDHNERRKIKKLLVEYADLHDARALLIKHFDSDHVSNFEEKIAEKRRAIFELTKGHKDFMQQLTGLTQVTLSSQDSVHSQLHLNEAVHKEPDFAVFKAKRIPETTGMDKEVHAHSIRLKGREIILSAVFVKCGHASVLPGGKVDPKELRADVGNVKNEKPQAFDAAGDDQIAVKHLYTITNSGLVKGAAGDFVDDLRDNMEGRTLITTISPIMAFRGQVAEGDFERKGEEGIRTDAIRTLRSNRDLAFDLHGRRNGARPVRVEAHESDPVDHATICYLYPSSKAAQAYNRSNASGAGAMVVTPDLNALFGKAGHPRVNTAPALIDVASECTWTRVAPRQPVSKKARAFQAA